MRTGDYNIGVDGDYNVSASNINESASGNLSSIAGGSNKVSGGSTVDIGAGIINLNTTGPESPSSGDSPTKAIIDVPPDAEILKEFPITEFSYKPDDLEDKVIIDLDDPDVPEVKEEAEEVENKEITEPILCGGKGFSDGDNISEFFTLGQVSSNAVVSKYKVRAQHGLTKEEIVCT